MPVQQRAITSIGVEIRGLQELPPLSLTTQRLLRLLADDDVEVPELAGAIEQDPALAARIVGLANSAFFGTRGDVHSVREAILRVLGLNLVRGLAVSIALSGHFQAARAPGFDLRRYWMTAMLTAGAARLLAPYTQVAGMSTADASYLAGLLHNIGLLAMAHVLGPELARVLAMADGAPEWTLPYVERELIGVDHYQVGTWLAARWQLPEDIVAVIAHHHDPEYRGLHWPLSTLTGHLSRLAQWRLEAADEAPLPAQSEMLRALAIPAERTTVLESFYAERYPEIVETATLLARGG